MQNRRYFDNIGLDRELLLEFFLTFARFEFALKTSGFATSRGGPASFAEPDWRCFAETLDLTTACLDSACADAVDFLSLSPPWREVLLTGTQELAWDMNTGFAEVATVVELLVLVRRVRNNLFHGGKFTDLALASERERNELLLRHSLAILHRCLELSPAVETSFDQAML
jgi:hypothetical protein